MVQYHIASSALFFHESSGELNEHLDHLFTDHYNFARLTEKRSEYWLVLGSSGRFFNPNKDLICLT